MNLTGPLGRTVRNGSVMEVIVVKCVATCTIKIFESDFIFVLATTPNGGFKPGITSMVTATCSMVELMKSINQSES